MVDISTFDESSLGGVNQLEALYLLLKQIRSSELLGKAGLIHFLMGADRLRRKLQSGIQISAHIPSYGNCPIDVESASTCEFGALTASVMILITLTDRFT